MPFLSHLSFPFSVIVFSLVSSLRSRWYLARASFVDPLFVHSTVNTSEGGERERRAGFSSRVSKFKIHDPISRAETAKTASTTPSTNLVKSSYTLGSYINSLGSWYLARVSCSLRFNDVSVYVYIYIYLCMCTRCTPVTTDRRGGHRKSTVASPVIAFLLLP